MSTTTAHEPAPQIKTGTEPATYGDLVALPGVPGVLWLIRDIRKIEDAGQNRPSRRSKVAALDPWHPADDEHPEPRPYGYDEPLRIGRAERAGVSIELSIYGDYDREADTYGPLRLHAWPQARSYSPSLTDAQRASLTAAAEALDGPRFYLPPLTPAEIRARVLGDGDYIGRTAADRSRRDHFPAIWSGAAASKDAVVAAFAEVATDDAAREAVTAWLDDAAAAYRAQMVAELRSFGAVAGVEL